MKNKAGRWILLSFAIVCLGLGFVLYRTFKDAGQYKGLILSQMHKEFLAYSALKQGQEKIPVATVDSKTYYVDLKKNWNFLLHDKLLIMRAPGLEPSPEPAVKAEVEKQAIEKLTVLLKTWLLDKFHTLDKITFQVEF